jgi:hypothetical protein
MFKNGYESFYFPGTDERPVLDRLAERAKQHLAEFVKTGGLESAVNAGDVLLAVQDEIGGKYEYERWMVAHGIWQHLAGLCCTACRTRDRLAMARRNSKARNAR